MTVIRSFIAALISFGFLVTSISGTNANESRKTYLIVLPSNVTTQGKQISALGGTVEKTLANIDTMIVKMSPTAVSRLASLNKSWVIEEEKVFDALVDQPNPPSWGLDRIDQRDLPLNSNYSYPSAEQGQGVTAYVIDTGIRRDHIEFSGRLRSGYQGYTDTTATGDCQGHGTHVAGTIGGSTVGEAKQVTLVPIVVLSCSGSGSSTVIAEGANWAVADHQSGTPAVANMSLGGGASSALDAVVTKMVEDGITVVVAAGNSGADACNYSPARAASAITVGATAINDSRTSWSNFGSCVDLFAPGNSIYSASRSGENTYTTMSGTSMASPAVAGVVARYLSANPTATPTQVWDALQPTLTTGKVTSPGTGSPNLLLYADPAGYQVASPTVPSQVTGLSFSLVTSNSAVANWTVPANGGSTITNYSVQISTTSNFSSNTSSYNPTSNSFTFISLNPSTAYYVRVSAINSVGSSDWSSVGSFTTATSASVPDAPSNFIRTNLTKNSVSFAWTPPAQTVSGYTLQISTRADFQSSSSFNFEPGISTATISGLRSRTKYFARINARNSSGAGPWSNPNLEFTTLR